MEKKPDIDSGKARAEGASPARAALPVAPLSDAERLACLRLARTPSVGPVSFRELINQFGGATEALAALPELIAKGGARNRRIATRTQALSELDAAQRIGAKPVFTIEPGYPHLLIAAGHPPPLIYICGDAGLLDRPCVAVVGSRKASAAGLTMASRLGQGLGAKGITVVSGLARGIDRAAHEAALSWGTAAVVAGGADVVYPPEHQELYAAIARDGCLMSEMPPGFTPRGKDFPRRNRIISGLSHGVVVIEAAERSGSLITARYALEQGREVFAVPGHPLDPRAFGTNRLIRDGATLVTGTSDIVEVLAPTFGLHDQADTSGWVTVPRTDDRDPPAATPEATRPAGGSTSAELSDADRTCVLGALGPAAVSIDDVVRATGIATPAVRRVLLELTLAGRIEHQGAQLVALKPPSSDEQP